MSTLSIINPSTEEQVRTVEMLDVEQTDQAIARSSKASPQWRAVTPADRARLLRRFSEVVDSHLEELAQLEVA
ncbi:MAG: aldehyde dehydrogenase family protein, partial [Acidimicrobiales bacterium]